MIEIVAEHGYDAVTVRGLTRAAGVSTQTFYKHFAGTEECFLRTYDLVMHCTARQIAAAQKDAGGDMRDAVRAGVDFLLQAVASKPEGARVCLVEAFAAGPVALERMRQAGVTFEALGNKTFASGEEVVSPLLVKGVVAGVTQVVRTALLSGRESELPELTEELVEWILCCHAVSLQVKQLPAVPHTPAVVADTVGSVDIGRAAIGDDRDLILAAVVRLAARDGYSGLSIRRIRAAAGVSRGSFDAHFRNVDDCFSAALDLLTDRVLETLVQAAEAAPHQPRAVEHALDALCAFVTETPDLASLLFTEAVPAGAAGFRYRERFIAALAAVLRAAVPAEQRPGELAFEASAATIWEITRRHLAAGKGHKLTGVRPALSLLVLWPALGSEATGHLILEPVLATS